MTSEFRIATPKRIEFRGADGRVCCSSDSNPPILCDTCKSKASITAATSDSEIPDGYALGLANLTKAQPAAAAHKAGWPKPPATMRLSADAFGEANGYQKALDALAHQEAR